MENPLDIYIQILRKQFTLGSLWTVDLNGRHLDGWFIDCPNFLADDWMKEIKEVIGNEATVNFLPNTQEIIIEPKPPKDEVGNSKIV